MRNNRQSFDDTGEIVFDSLDDEFGDAEDFDDTEVGFANEDDFDDEGQFAEAEDYEEPDSYEEEPVADEEYYDEAGIYGEEELVEVQPEVREKILIRESGSSGQNERRSIPKDNAFTRESLIEDDIPYDNADSEEYFDDHVEYFYDKEFDEDENIKESDKDSGNELDNESDNEDGSIEEYLEDEDEEGDGRSLGVMERIMIAIAACVVLALIVVGGVILINKPFNKPESNINENGIVYNPELAGAGSELSGIEVIGGSGLQNAFETKKDEGQPEDEVDEVTIEEDDFQETEYKNEIEVGFETVSVVKDLKIKIINKKTGKLIANVPFVVTVTTPSGTIQTWNDSDKDGIIYYSNIAAGDYKLHLEALDSTKYAGYVLPSDSNSKVKAEIAYEKVDVSGEVLAAGDVNEATEDTARDGADSGSVALTNTVAWVDSTKVDVGYYELPSGVTINNKPDLACLDIVVITVSDDTAVGTDATGGTGDGGNGTGDSGSGTGDGGSGTGDGGSGTGDGGSGNGDGGSGTGDGGNGNGDGGNGTGDSGSGNGDGGNGTGDGGSGAGESKQKAGTISDTSDRSIAAGSTAKIVVDCSDNAKIEYSFSVADIAIADNSANKKEITVKGIKAGDTVLTVTISEDGKETVSEKINIKVTAIKGGITIAKEKLSIVSGKTASSEVTLKDLTTADVTVSSDKAAVATAAFDANGKLIVTGVAEGSANIILTQKSDSSVTAKLPVTVYAATATLTATVDGKSTDVYIKDASGNYKKATYADYTDGAKFYYYLEQAKYTGWQTIDGKTYYYTAEGKPVTGEQVINGVMYNFDSNGALSMGSGTLGIDVSKWNGDINWSKVKAAGVSYVIIRVGYRGSTLGGLIDDANFKKNIEGAQAAGLKVGVYFVTQAVNDAEAVYEASMVLDRISKYTISYPIFLDVEASGGRGDKIDVATRTSVCKTFCKTIQNAGYTAGIYANKSWLTTMIDTSQLTGYKIWCAQYYTSCTYSGTVDIWQYSESGTIDGISGKVDLNKSYLGY